jgi:hypothetical protein
MTVFQAFSTLRRRSLAALLFLGAASTGLAPSLDGDLWWHLAAGREMWARGELLLSDPFSVSAAGRPWIDVHWLFQLAAYSIHQAVGLAGLVWVKCALIGLGALLLWGALGRQRASSWTRPTFVTLLVGALFLSRSLLLLRPVIVSLLLLAVFFYVLESFGRDGRASRLLALPLLQVVWANCQGLSALGPAVVGAYVVAAGLSTSLSTRGWPFAHEVARPLATSRHLKLLSLALLGCCIGALVTPFGLRGLTLPATLLSRLVPADHNVFSHAVAENVPPFVLERWAGEFWHVKWFLGLLALAMLAGGRRLRFSHVLLVLGFAGLGLMSNRNVLLLYWIAAPIAALYLGPGARRLAHAWRGLWARRVAYAMNALALTALLCLSGIAAAREPSLAEPSPFRMPSESARRLQSLPPAGNIFSADHQGGYLIWQLYPRFRPYIDTRLVLRSPREFSEYLGLADQPARFDAFQSRHSFGYVVLPTAYPDRYLGLIRHLYTSRDWKLLYTDGAEVLFARSNIETDEAWDLGDAATTDRILELAERRFRDAPKLLAAARLQLATLNAAVGEPEQAERALSGLGSAEALALLARCRLATGDTEGAERLTLGLLARDRDDVRSLSLMAQIAMRRGQPPLVVRFLRQALSVDPFDTEANQLLANLEETEP